MPSRRAARARFACAIAVLSKGAAVDEEEAGPVISSGRAMLCGVLERVTDVPVLFPKMMPQMQR